MPIDSPDLLEGLTEAALILDHGQVAAANAAARDLLGSAIRGSALHQVITHPGVLAAPESGTDPDGAELMHSALLADGTSLIRFLDRSEARAAEQMRVDFVANASHELRTPLSTLIGYTETLREQAEDIDRPTRERFLAIVHDEARRMQRVVEDLISLSRIEAEKFTAPTEAVDVASLIEQAAGSARRMADERDSEIVREIQGELPAIAGRFFSCSIISSPTLFDMEKRGRRSRCLRPRKAPWSMFRSPIAARGSPRSISRESPSGSTEWTPAAAGHSGGRAWACLSSSI